MASSGALLFLLLAAASWHALAFDPSPLQDFCVADGNSQGDCNLACLLMHAFRYIYVERYSYNFMYVINCCSACERIPLQGRQGCDSGRFRVRGDRQAW